MRAKYFESLPDKAVRCVLCPQFCEIADGGRGICGMRVNEKGTLTALGYGHAAAFAMDPIEKKPLYHWHPGSAILSTGGYGCNLTCSFCQNWHLSRNNSIGESVTPSGLVSMAIAEGSTAIAYTYNEPLVNFEFLLDCAKAARIAGLANVIVSNGFINSPPLSELQPFLDAANIDLKGSDEFYKKLCTGRATPVKEAIVGLHKAG
ncbi:MAG: radical SAM protein, partial [Candidatus Brocadiia bacterium]